MSKKATALSSAKRSVKAKQRSRRSNEKQLDRYNQKRHFEITAEPRGKFERRRKESDLHFVIQQHDARRMHFDFRLELNGVLKSWAVPKGPSLSPTEKRLAVEVEDHPFSYREFEGVIPEGEYGGGNVIVWDVGTWKPEGDADAGLKKGHLAFSLAGEKTNGRFSLVRLRNDRSGNKKTNWLLIKSDDDFARDGDEAEVTQRMPESILSGRTVDQVSSKLPTAKTRIALEKKGGASNSGKASAQKKSRRKSLAPTAMPQLSDLSPQLATLTDGPPSDGNYLYEIKFDGYRALSSISNGAVHIRSRNDLDWSKTFPVIANELAGLDVTDAIVDGEICFVDTDGRTRFQGLQNVMGTRGHQKVATDDTLIYFLFDVLWLNGKDLRNLPLSERKQHLRSIIKSKKSSVLQYSDDNRGDMRVALTQACKLGLEGLIAKRIDRPYEEGRSRSWLKLKCGKRQEFVIVGFIEPEGSRTGFRSLLLGLYEHGKLKYSGKVGTGFSEESLKALSRELKSRIIKNAGVENPPLEKGIRWVRPDLLCEVSYTEFTRDGSLRHPSFQGLRHDKNASEITHEKPANKVGPVKRKKAVASKVRSSNAHSSTGDLVLDGIKITHPDRIVDEKSGVSKADLARYYEKVADWFLQYATDRPMALVRCPQGHAQQCFFQKNAMPALGRSVKRGKAAGHGILSIDSAKGIYELVQFNAMEFHGWGARRPKLTKPDWIVFDLDPDTALPFSTVVDAAFEIRDALAGLDLVSFVKTTGGKGLHVTVPITPKLGWTDTKTFTRRIAETLAAQRPDRYVANMAIAKRKGKIFIDYLRNGEGSTAVLPYSSRARAGATVAVPVAWKDLKSIAPGEFRVDNVDRWLSRRRVDPWADFFQTAQALPELSEE